MYFPNADLLSAQGGLPVKYIILLTITTIAIIAIIVIKSSIASETDASRQLIVVITPTWNDLKARMYRFEKSEKGWQKLIGHFDAVVGSNGLAWGIGLHKGNIEVPVKKEGDRKAPAGMFRLVKSMGYAAAPPVGVTFPYVQISDDSHCIDDKESRYYNQIVKESDLQTPAAELWKSSEHMKRKDILYKWLVVVDHNMKNPEPGAGSCIFIHVWRSPEKGTAGCTAMEEKML
jgi:L,D-peptidoglycan transpeptidase YkuD (ErfK/YbiS/YcfS/YnhG family)